MRFGVQVGRGGLESSASVNVEWVGGGSDLAELVWELLACMFCMLSLGQTYYKNGCMEHASGFSHALRQHALRVTIGEHVVTQCEDMDEEYRQQELSHATIPFWLAAFARVATMSATRHL